MKSFFKLSSKIDKVKLDDHERFARDRRIAREQLKMFITRQKPKVVPKIEQ
jgi:hypothetical protein